MVTRSAAPWLLVLLAALPAVAACRPDARCKPIERCDVREPDCQERAQSQALCLRGRDEAAEPVEVAVTSEEDYERELLDQAEAAPPTPEREQMRRGLALLGLAAASDDPEQDAHDQAEHTAGYFDPETGRIVIIDHGAALDGASATLVLVHEMVHALQQRAGDLQVGEGLQTFDAQQAADALIEGEATLWKDEATTEGYDYSFREIDYAASLASYRGGARGHIEQSEDPIDDVYSSFSYAFGASYLWPLVKREGAAAVANAFGDPPQSSYAVIQADPWSADSRPNDLGESAMPDLELTLVGTLHLGRFMFEVAADLWEPTLEFPWPMSSWGEPFVADTLSVFVDDEDHVLVGWRLRFDESSEDIDEAARELADLNPSLRVGFEDQDLWLFAAESDALIEALPEELSWTAAPDADFGYGQDDEPEARRVVCPLRH